MCYSRDNDLATPAVGNLRAPGLVSAGECNSCRRRFSEYFDNSSWDIAHSKRNGPSLFVSQWVQPKLWAKGPAFMSRSSTPSFSLPLTGPLRTPRANGLEGFRQKLSFIPQCPVCRSVLYVQSGWTKWSQVLAAGRGQHVLQYTLKATQSQADQESSQEAHTMRPQWVHKLNTMAPTPGAATRGRFICPRLSSEEQRAERDSCPQGAKEWEIPRLPGPAVRSLLPEGRKASRAVVGPARDEWRRFAPACVCFLSTEQQSNISFVSLPGCVLAGLSGSASGLLCVQ